MISISRFKYEIKLNKRIINNVEQGFSLSRELEEALDNGNLRLLFSDLELPIQQYSLLEINAYELEVGSNEIVEELEYEFLVISDRVELNSKYKGYYIHNLSVIEYTAKFDLYMQNAFSYSKRIEEKRKEAPYEYVLMEFVKSPGVIRAEREINFAFPTQYNSQHFLVERNAVIEKPFIQKTFDNNTIIKQTKVGKYSFVKDWLNNPIVEGGNEVDFVDVDIYIKTNAPINNNYYILSNQDVEFNLPLGEWEIEVGFKKPYETYDGIIDGRYEEDIVFEAQDIPVYRFFVNSLGDEEQTMYDVLMNIRDLVSSYGGIESKLWYEETRLFDIDPNIVEELKSIEAPQIYIPSATTRQLLIFTLSYLNSLPRLIRNGDDIDILTIEKYGEKIGLYDKEDISENYSEQNTNQIGTRSYADLKNILPNDLNEPSTYVPYQNGFQTVRATNIQLIDDEGFELKLPKDKPIYKPIDFEIEIPIKVSNPELMVDPSELEHKETIKLSLNELLIDYNEWQLKEITTNFPSAYFTTPFNLEVGLGKYKTENFYWREGDTSLKLGDVDGVMFKDNRLRSVIAYAFAKFITSDTNMYSMINSDNKSLVVLDYFIDIEGYLNNPLWFKDIKFNFTYITNENLVIKQDKEDLTQIDFYSELRQNQTENTISLGRSSAKLYGDLQRTGNKENTFTKYHTSLKDLYKVGQVDQHDNVITSITLTFLNNYIIANYTITKHHNRISQATFIDQTYRFRDNYASELLNRYETYNDYLILVPKEKNYDRYGLRKLNHQNTKIRTKRFNNDDTPYIYKVIFGNMGVKHNIKNTKATFVGIRTDGSIKNYKDNNGFHQIISNLSSSGYKQGFVFKFGFQDNQVAGDGLVLKDNNWYNQAIRYTDTNAKLKYLDFYIMNNYRENEEKRRTFPLYNFSNFDKRYFNDNNNVSNDNNLLYFSTGNIVNNETAEDSLIVNKDIMSNIHINYAINVLSYNYGDFIFGRKFYTRNQIVYNKDENYKVYLYIYENGTKYDIFEDLNVKSGYRDKIDLQEFDNVYLTTHNGYTTINIEGLSESDTSFAIGTENKELIFASNINVNEIEIINKHIRPGIREVGKGIYPPIDYTFTIDDAINYNINSESVIQETYSFDIIDNIKYNVYSDSIIQDTYSFIIEDDINYNIDSSGIRQDRYYIDIQDNIGYVIETNAIKQKEYNLNIYDNILNKTWSEGFKQETYNIDIIDNINYNLSSTGITQKEYNLEIIEYISYTTNAYGIKQKEYEFSVYDNIGYMTSSSGFTQQEYDLTIFDNIGYKIDKNAIVQKEYELEVNDDIKYYINKTTNIEDYIPEEPTTQATSNNFGEVKTGKDGYSRWRCERKEINEYRWRKTNEKTRTTSHPTASENSICDYEGQLGRSPLPDFDGWYDLYECKFNDSWYEYYWKLLD